VCGACGPYKKLPRHRSGTLAAEERSEVENLDRRGFADVQQNTKSTN
jgi:hypothetical protein